MTALFKFLVTVPFVAALLWIVFANRDSISFTWNPLQETSQVPVAVIILVTAVAGFIWGALIVWLNGAPARRAYRHKKKEVTRLEKELNEVRISTPPSETVPLLK